jgi:hypothetical protein
MSTWLKRALLFVGIFFLCIPVTWIVAMMLTPVLWRLELILHMELAGHSGPSDWVFYVVHAIVVLGVFALALKVFGRPAPQR